jgi:hypothetical protein
MHVLFSASPPEIYKAIDRILLPETDFAELFDPRLWRLFGGGTAGLIMRVLFSAYPPESYKCGRSYLTARDRFVGCLAGTAGLIMHVLFSASPPENYKAVDRISLPETDFAELFDPRLWGLFGGV